MDDAASVGEAEWARRELLPLIGLRTPSLQLEERDLLTALASLIVTIGWATEIKRLIAAQQAAADDAQTGQPEITGIFCPT